MSCAFWRRHRRPAGSGSRVTVDRAASGCPTAAWSTPTPTARSTALPSTRSCSSCCVSGRAPSPSTATTPRPTQGSPTTSRRCSVAANDLLGEWAELEAVVPSLEHEVTLAGRPVRRRGHDQRRQLAVAVAVASGRTVGELATSLRPDRAGRVPRRCATSSSWASSTSPCPTSRPAAVVPPAPAAPRPSAAPVGRPAHADHVPRARRSPGPPPGQNQRAGWLSGDRTGEIPRP